MIERENNYDEKAKKPYLESHVLVWYNTNYSYVPSSSVSTSSSVELGPGAIVTAATVMW